MYQPTTPRLIIAKSRISQESWDKRVSEAEAAKKIVEDIEQRVAFGLSLNLAISLVLPKEKRSWAIRSVSAFREGGFETLIDARMPPAPKLSRHCKDIINTAILTNSSVTIAEVLKLFEAQAVGSLPDESTIKAELRRAGARRRYAEKRQREQRSSQTIVEDLPMAGGELLLAAELETGLIGAVTDEVCAISEEAKEASKGQEPKPDRARRDARGRFTAEYNRVRKRKEGQAIASFMRTAEEKGAEKVPSWPRFMHERRDTLERKILNLTFEPLVNPSHGWDGLRAEGIAQGLAPLCGFAYMPTTLEKIASALAQSSAGPRLLSVVGSHWHQVATAQWDEEGAMAALYVDNHVKEVWSKLFTRAGKVSHRSRVMPCVTTTYVHTGAGTPLWVAVQSGSAPLAPRLAEIVKSAEAQLDDEVRRIVVIDAEGSVFDILSSFTKAERVIVTPLRSEQAKNLELSYGPGSYFRPFRQYDELRVAQATLHHKSTERSQELSALIVRRTDGSGQQVLLTNGPQLGVAGRVAAQTYFSRWSVQENSFKEGTAALKLNHHRGNNARMVSNVAVVTKLERLEGRLETAEERFGHLTGAREGLEGAIVTTQREQDQAERELSESLNQLTDLRGSATPPPAQLSDAAVRLHDAVLREKASRAARDHAEEARRKNERAYEEQLGTIEQLVDRISELEPQQQIRQLDVALESVLTSFKLIASLLIMFVLREYLSSYPMTPETFVNRVLSIRGRREVSPEREDVVFYKNSRDAEMNEALSRACEELNKRKLKRHDRILCYHLEEPPSGLRTFSSGEMTAGES
jgi:hypothetical protein